MLTFLYELLAITLKDLEQYYKDNKTDKL